MPMPSGNSSDRSSSQAGAAPRDPAVRVPSSSVYSSRSSIDSRTYYFDSKTWLFPGVTLPLRSMLVVTGEQEEILISPVCTPEEALQVGAPLTLVSPSTFHHRHHRHAGHHRNFAAAIERYRPLAVWGPPGLAEDLREFDALDLVGPVRVFGIDAWPYSDQLEFVVIEGGPQHDEVVFFHRASRTIYTADLCFNIHEPAGLLAPLVFRWMGIYGRFAIPKMWHRWVTDRAAFARSVDQILGWDFDRIVVAHGDVVDQGARALVETALRELHAIA